MTSYLILNIVLAVASYFYLIHQFQLAAKKHSGSITEVFQSGDGIEKLINKYWNILLALLCCMLFLGLKTGLEAAASADSISIPISICVLAFSVSMFSKIPDIHTRYRIPGNLSRLYIFIRGSYLVVYELFFRGLLLQVSLDLLQPGMAVVLNVVLYAIAHMYSPKSEFLACIPLGFLFCWLRLEYDTLLFPILLHLCMALPFEIRILRSFNQTKNS
jgi:membrane protease YdiL (CAAX protease family)